MRVLNHFETLLFYDGPQLFVAHDQLGVAFICLLIEAADDVEKYLCVPVTKGRLNNFLHGEIDLRTTILESETGEAFIGISKEGNLSDIELVPVVSNEIPEEWLPEEGLYLSLQEVGKELVAIEAQEKQR